MASFFPVLRITLKISIFTIVVSITGHCKFLGYVSVNGNLEILAELYLPFEHQLSLLQLLTSHLAYVPPEER